MFFFMPWLNCNNTIKHRAYVSMVFKMVLMLRKPSCTTSHHEFLTRCKGAVSQNKFISVQAAKGATFLSNKGPCKQYPLWLLQKLTIISFRASFPTVRNISYKGENFDFRLSKIPMSQILERCFFFSLKVYFSNLLNLLLSKIQFFCSF